MSTAEFVCPAVRPVQGRESSRGAKSVVLLSDAAQPAALPGENIFFR